MSDSDNTASQTSPPPARRRPQASESFALSRHRLVEIVHRLSRPILQIPFFYRLLYSLFFYKVVPREQCVHICTYIYIHIHTIVYSRMFDIEEERERVREARCHALFSLSPRFELVGEQHGALRISLSQ